MFLEYATVDTKILLTALFLASLNKEHITEQYGVQHIRNG